MNTKLEQVRDDLSAEKTLSPEDCWFLIEEVSRYRELVRHAKYQTIQADVRAAGDAFIVNVVASEEATERMIVKQVRRLFMQMIRIANK